MFFFKQQNRKATTKNLEIGYFFTQKSWGQLISHVDKVGLTYIVEMTMIKTSYCEKLKRKKWINNKLKSD